MDSYSKAIVLAALGEYAITHPEFVAQVDQAEAAVRELPLQACEQLDELQQGLHDAGGAADDGKGLG